jgi:alpha-N-acetylglucosamine transferase
MNDGVKILLERMKTNPEEFGGVHSKWNYVISEHIAFLEEIDRLTITGAIDKIMQQRFTEEVMKELIDPQRETKDWVERVVTSKGTTWGRLQV